MSKQLLLALSCALALPLANARDNAATAAQANFAATRSHYAQLLAGPAPKVAELTLFTNLLPKGADLHHHYSGAIYAETYLDWAKALGWCIYRASDPALRIEQFKVETKPQALQGAARDACLDVDAVRKDNDLYRGLLTRWSDKDYHNHFHHQPPPDKQFFDTFNYFGPVSGYDYNLALKHLKARAQAENVGYIETMLKGGPGLRDVAAYSPLLDSLGAAATADQVDEALIRAYTYLRNDPATQQLIKEHVEVHEAAAAGVDDATFRLRFQGYASRNSDPSVVFSSLYTSFVAATLRPQLIVGVNIVGPENGIVAMRDYSLHMKMLGFLKRQFPQVKLALHAGELALGMVPPEGLRFHIREAVTVAGAERIGHGIDIAHEDGAVELMAAMRQRPVAVEVNLSSNDFILGVKGEAHPVLLYARHGVPFVLSTDDAGVSRNNLSHEYMLYATRYKPDYAALKRLSYDSLRYSFLPEEVKRDEIARLDARFAEFEARIARLPRAPR
ncbi:adenosine deaminase family protein [Azohydromonas aeria]|uniref:adenosine deaminase family protein n=1 Tax=Azohydromonas aeria TaxID=2590212 RepID=UPI0012F8AA75|nr:adenosine deaminase [Azohydromonas aeria]